MPNFAYANQTNFRPFSYQEMLAPVLMATQAHQALEEAYSELDSQANAVGSLANETNDPVAFARYKAYETSLRDQADSLAKNGLTPGSRKSLLDLRGRYSKDIVPIKNAITRRRELADEQRKALLQNPTLMFQRDLNSLSYESSLDRFLENPDYDYGERYSGALLTQQVSQAASNLAKELSSYGNGKRLDAFTKTFIQRHGFTRAQVLDAINNPNRANSQPVLNAIVEQVIGSSNMPKWADNNTMNRAYNYARQGLWSAIGQTQVSPYEDYGAKLAAQDYYRRKAKAEEEASLNLRTRGNLPIDTVSLLSPSAEGTKGADRAKKALNFFRINSQNNKAHMYHGVGVLEAGHAVDARNKKGENRFQLWTKDGRLLTKYQFMQQGKTAEDKRRLGLFYDRDVKQNAAALGFDLDSLRKQGKTPTIRNMTYNARNISTNASPFSMGAMKIKFTDDKKVLDGLLPQLMSNEDETYIKEVSSFDKTGKIKDTGKIIKKDVFLNDDGTLKGTPLFYATPNVNTDGILMKFKGKTYLIPRAKLGSLSNSTYNIDIPALNNALARKAAWVDKFGEAAYYSSEEGQYNEQIIDNSGANFLRSAYNTLGWSAKAPVYDTVINNESQIP